jgi:acyl-CoA thioesterase
MRASLQEVGGEGRWPVTGASEFDQAVDVQVDPAGRVRGHVAEGWDVGGAPNGGYIMAIAVRAMLTAVSRPDPLSVTAHYLAPARPGPVDVDVAPLRVGSRHETVLATMHQGGRAIATLIATFADLGDAGESAYVASSAPVVPPPDESVKPVPGPVFDLPPITQRVELRLHPSHVGFAMGAPHGVAEVSGWARFADGREPDTVAHPLFADALPPAVFNAGLPLGWVPTVEFTVQVRQRPAPGWLLGRFTTRFVTGGYLEEDGELWDARGQLVALSRQLALAPRQNSHSAL